MEPLGACARENPGSARHRESISSRRGGSPQRSVPGRELLRIHAPASPGSPARSAGRGAMGWTIALGEDAGRDVQLLLCDVRVAGHGGEVGMAEILSDQASVPGGLAQPCGRGMADGVRGDVLVDAGARGVRV